MVVGEAESTLGIGALQVCRKNWKEPEDNSGPDRLQLAGRQTPYL